MRVANTVCPQKRVLAMDKQQLWFINIGPGHTCSQNGNVQFLRFLVQIFCDDHVHTTFQNTSISKTLDVYYVPYFSE